VHTPSEHTIDGQPLDGEIHFVHKTADGKAALVIGLFLQKTEAQDTEPAVDIIVDAMSEVTPNTSIPLTLYVRPDVVWNLKAIANTALCHPLAAPTRS